MDNFVFFGVYVVDCRWSEPFTREHREFSDLAYGHRYTMGLFYVHFPAYKHQFRYKQGTAAGVMHDTRSGGNCAGRATISRYVSKGCHCDSPEDLLFGNRCRQSLTVEALGWTEFGLSVLTLVATCLWVHTSSRSYVSDCS